MGKYLFLYLKTGGGHLAPAKAVAEKIKTKRKVDVEILLVDGFSESNIFVKKVIEDGYKNAINKALKLKNKYGIDNPKVYGFVDFVHSLVSISDVVITKCGASTPMEILIMGKVSDYILNYQ